jgi:hypothetical protein
VETKPYRIQSPEDIAKDYGGNKQKIAQAMQMGVVDPTAGVLAGMFIDRMRSAQVQETAPQPSVAQQVMGGVPQAPGAPPMGGMPPAPPMGAPPMGAPPMGAPPMGAPPMGGMPPGAPPMSDMPMGMADGGLAALPISNYMFDEPDNGGYANGGIVSFADAGPVGSIQEGAAGEKITVTGRRYPKGPDQYYGYYRDPEAERAKIERMYKPDRAAGTALMDFFGETLSPEAQKKRSNEDKYFALAQLGATMASTPGGLLRAFSAGVGKALPGLRESAKERRAEQREAIIARAQQEGLNNKEARDMYGLIMDGTGKYGQFDVDRLGREQRADLTRYEQRMANYRARVAAEADKYRADKQSNTQRDYFAGLTGNIIKQTAAAATAQLPQLRSDLTSEVGAAHNQLKMAVSGGNKKAIADARAAVAKAEADFVNGQVALATNAGMASGLPSVPGAPGGGMPQLPPGFVSDQ